jgi:hypothetical protein
MRCTGELETIARCAGKLGKELVAEERPKPASREMEAERKKGSRTDSRRERRVAEPFGACHELAGGLSTCFHPAERLGLGCGEHGFHRFNQGQ